MLNLWQRIQERIRDASIRMQQISRHKLADLHPGKHWGAPTHPHTHRRKQEEGVAAEPGLWQHPACCCPWWTEKVAPIRLLSPS